MEEYGKKRKTAGITSKKGAIAGLIAGILLIAGIIGVIVYVIYPGSIFGPPSGPPIEYATGYARIYLVNGIDRSYVNSNEVHLIYADNLTAWDTSGSTGSTFYSPAGSVFWVNVTNYYPVAKTLYASGGDDLGEYRNNTVNVFKRADPSDVSVTLVSWQNTTSGVYNYSGILPHYDGAYKLEFRVSINGQSRGNCVYGYNQWVPNYTLPTETWASNSSWNFIALWFGWEGAITDYQIVKPSWIYQDIYNINTLNCTVGPNVFGYDSTYIFQGNFTNLQSIRVYDGLIDNWENYAGIITR